MLLRELSSRYKLRNLISASESSIKAWDIAFRMYDRFLGRDALISDLTDDTMSGFIHWRKSRGVAAATVNRDLVSLLACWRWGHRIGVVPCWPQVQLLKVPNRTPLAWTQDEFTQLLTAARSVPGHVGAIRACDWWPALLLTLFDTAERISAVLSLEWSNTQLDSGWVRFPAETRKGQRDDSLVKLHPQTCDALRVLKQPKHQRVFHWPFCKERIWAHYGRLLDRAGLPNDRTRKFHCVRKTTASYVEAAGGNATKALRHVHRKTTESYLDPRIVTPSQSIDYLWRPDF